MISLGSVGTVAAVVGFALTIVCIKRAMSKQYENAHKIARRRSRCKTPKPRSNDEIAVATGAESYDDNVVLVSLHCVPDSYDDVRLFKNLPRVFEENEAGLYGGEVDYESAHESVAHAACYLEMLPMESDEFVSLSEFQRNADNNVNLKRFSSVPI